MLKPKLINKKLVKQVARKCRICKFEGYETLEVHRIQGGNTDKEYIDKNRYVENNTICICGNCHALVHTGKLIIHQWYMSTAGRMLHITRNGIDEFV